MRRISVTFSRSAAINKQSRLQHLSVVNSPVINFFFFCDSTENTDNDTRSKMVITIEVVSKVLNHLKANDRLAIIRFDNGTSVVQPMKKFNRVEYRKLEK